MSDVKMIERIHSDSSLLQQLGWRLTVTRTPHRIQLSRKFCCTFAAPSFNGRTADSGSAYRGSNPWGAAKLESIAYDLWLPPKQPTGNKNR
jgi:hypothetical protein